MPSFSAKHATAKKSLAFILFPGTKLLDFSGPLQVFGDACLPDGTPAYTIDMLSERGGLVETDTICSVNSISFKHPDLGPWDTVIVSGGDAAYQAMTSDALLGFINTASQSCRRLGSVCLGAFILAAGGHLTAKRATTHWDGCGRLAKEFADIEVDEDAIFIEDEGVWTSAGVTAGIDMALAMVQQDLGPKEALRIAKNLVLPMQRSGGQRQFSGTLSMQSSGQNTRFAELIMSIGADLRQNLSVSAMASKAGMSERSFSRFFCRELGVSPAKFVERLRVERAAELLHHGNLVMAASEAGFSNTEQMRRAFHRCKGVSPSDYAAKFARPPGKPDQM